MKPQVIHNMPFEEYKEIDALNISKLVGYSRSPKRFRYLSSKPDDETPAMRLGRAIHTMTLEPDRFPLEYAVWPGTRRGKEYEAFKASNEGRTILNQSEYETSCQVRDAVREDSVSGPLVNAIKHTEVTLVWEMHGCPCKARLDAITDDLLIDLKTTGDPGQWSFASVAARLHYHAKIAWYTQGLGDCGIDIMQAKIIAVQNNDEHDVVVYNLREADLGHGENQWMEWMDQHIKAMRHDAWPGIANGQELTLDLPQWAQPGDDVIMIPGEEA